MAKKAKRTIVGSPLTPSMLTELGAVKRIPSLGEAFDPTGDWEQTYRIWTCHGYRESGNQDVGSVQIKKDVAQGGKTFTLSIRQTVAETDALLCTIEAEIECLSDAYASPTGWQMAASFVGADGQAIKDLGSTETASVEGNTIAIKTPTGTRHRPVERPMTCDWCLFEAVQRLGFDGDARDLEFSLLEGLSLPKAGQRLSYRGRQRVTLGPEAVPLHCFQQLGRGVLPTEYWLDERHRLVAVTSMNKAYILQDA